MNADASPPSNLAAELHSLQTLRNVLGEEMYNQGLTRLRAQYGDAAVDALLAPSATPPEPAASRQDIRNDAPNQGAQGIFYGDVYLYGQRGKDAAALLAGYLERQLQDCDRLSLQGVYEQKAADDVLQISLEQVYTQLAVAELADRETFTGAALEQFAAAAYLQAHRAAEHLPGAQRDRCIVQGGAAARRMDAELPEYRLESLAPDDLARLARDCDRLSFQGPRLVTEAIIANRRLVLLGEPGSGKSTALRYLALTLAQAGLDEAVDRAAHLEGWDRLGDAGRLLPIFLPLLRFVRRFVDSADHLCGADDLWNYIAAELEAGGRYEGLAATVHEELEQGRVLLMLDGLDEVAGDESRRQAVRAVQAFGERYPQCRIVVTCRVRAYVGEPNRAWQLPGWPTATLADWTLGQMQHFVQAWYAAATAVSGMAPARRDDRIEALQRAITLRDDLKRLGVRPLRRSAAGAVGAGQGGRQRLRAADRLHRPARCRR